MFSNKHKVLSVFFDNLYPEGGLGLREISNKINLAPTSVKNYLEELIKENLVVQKKHRYLNQPKYYPSLSDEFKFLKTQHILSLIKKTKLDKYIYESCFPNCIILFGSASIGEDSVGSDVDLFVQSPRKKLELKKFEKVLNRKINVFFQESFENLSEELKNNLVNGIMIKGYLNAFTKKNNP